MFVFRLIYSYATDASYELAARESWDEEAGTDLSSRTIAKYFSWCRDAVIHDFCHGIGQRGRIGGPGKIVEIDESKVSKILTAIFRIDGSLI
jgi:hypothetical protein